MAKKTKRNNKKPFYYLKMYREWMLRRESFGGLCYLLKRKDKLLELFTPTEEEEEQLREDNTPDGYWGADNWETMNHFGERRQTILLFMAAMNNEL